MQGPLFLLKGRGGCAAASPPLPLAVSNSGGATSEDWIAGIGVGQNLPNATDNSFPWMWLKGSSTRVDANLIEYLIDVKAKRAFRDSDDGHVFTIRNNDGVNSILYRFVLRCLWLLP